MATKISVHLATLVNYAEKLAMTTRPPGLEVVNWEAIDRITQTDGNAQEFAQYIYNSTVSVHLAFRISH